MEPTSRKPNALLHSTSPYLLQHAYNPVDWHPWSADSLAKAKAQNKPIFLSIGYSACHWCHVMEHQVFENESIAALMNAHFINIKVDREERPDLDDLYMLATQLMTGQGGWPMSVFLTPDLKPFYAGTYFPPTDMHGRPGFPRLLTALADSWQNKRATLVEQSEKVVAAIKQHADETATSAATTPDEIDAGPWIAEATQHFLDAFDTVNGGLGSAPKFPPHQALNLWLKMLQLLPAQNTSRDTLNQIQTMLTKTLDGMMLGGIYDHLAGGFARYSTDEKWLVPHFEKMLYDNAQLAPIYAQASVLLNNPNYATTARGTLDFWLRDMTGPDGQFFSTLDADSEGEEGKFYVWSLAEIREAFPDPADQQLLIQHFNLTDHGNWHESPIPNGHVLAIAKQMPDDHERLEPLLLEMRQIRSSRAWPALDDKVLTSWNALFIAALAIAARTLNDPAYLAAAKKSLAYLQTHHMNGAQLLRVSRKENEKISAHTPAFLDDHAYLLHALLELHTTTQDASLLTQAESLATTLLQNFEDKQNGGFFFTTPQHEQLFTRMKNAGDNATPSPAGIAIHALLQLTSLTNNPTYESAAHRAIAAIAPHIARRPDYFPTILTALLSASYPQSPAATAASEQTNIPSSQNEPSPTNSPSPEILTLTAPPELHLTPNSPLRFTLTLQIAPTYHIQPATNPQEGMHPTTLKLRTDLPLSASMNFPPPTLINNDFPGYESSLEIIIESSLQQPTSPGRYKLRAILTAQPCTSTHCLEPQSLSIDIPLTLS